MEATTLESHDDKYLRATFAFKPKGFGELVRSRELTREVCKVLLARGIPADELANLELLARRYHLAEMMSKYVINRRDVLDKSPSRGMVERTVVLPRYTEQEADDLEFEFHCLRRELGIRRGDGWGFMADASISLVRTIESASFVLEPKNTSLLDLPATSSIDGVEKPFQRAVAFQVAANRFLWVGLLSEYSTPEIVFRQVKQVNAERHIRHLLPEGATPERLEGSLWHYPSLELVTYAYGPTEETLVPLGGPVELEIFRRVYRQAKNYIAEQLN